MNDDFFSVVININFQFFFLDIYLRLCHDKFTGKRKERLISIVYACMFFITSSREQRERERENSQHV